MTPWAILYQCNFSSSDQLYISLVQCALSWDIENSNPISTNSHVLFCLSYKHHRPLQTTWEANLLRNENLLFIHQPYKVSRKASDFQQLIGDTNQRILYNKHLFLVIFHKRYSSIKFTFSAFIVTTLWWISYFKVRYVYLHVTIDIYLFILSFILIWRIGLFFSVVG